MAALRTGLERQVSTLLRRAGNPRVLAASPLMAAVCRATGKRDAVAALEHIVREALGGDDRRKMRLRDAIFEVDFKRATTNAELARRIGVSRRHFQRWRAEALGAIAQYARELLRPSCLDPPGLERERSATVPAVRGQRYGASWRFNRERTAFLRARDQSRAIEMRCIAGSLLRLAANQESSAFAWKCLIEASVHLAKTGDVIEQLECLDSSPRLYLRAKLALLAEQADEAEQCARAALPTIDAAERYHCVALISQARLMRSQTWRPPAEAASLLPRSWEQTAMDVERARHHARDERWSEAHRLALSAQRQAEMLGFHGLAARSAAVLSACADARGAIAQSWGWRAHAIELLLGTDDRLLATGLFLPTTSQGECTVDALLSDVLYRRLCLIVPQILGESEPQRAVVCRLLAELMHWPARSPSRCAGLARTIALVARSDSALAHYLQLRAAAVNEMLALTLAALTRLSWNAALERLGDVVAETARQLRPVTPRTIAISVPQCDRSQLTAINHLRVNDERSAECAGSTEDGADLRLRVVPFRSSPGSALPRRHGDSFAGTCGEVAAVTDSR